MITLIVARAINGAIGRAGTIPWEVPEDLRLFQRETVGGALIMGRQTWISLPVRPLPKRLNIVVSSDPAVADTVVPTIADAIALATSQGHHRIYGIGGARIYKEMLPLAHRLLVTEVDLSVPDADTFFPDFNRADWTRIGGGMVRAEGPACRLDEYLRRG